jgi:hypothetical protein
MCKKPYRKNCTEELQPKYDEAVQKLDSFQQTMYSQLREILSPEQIIEIEAHPSGAELIQELLGMKKPEQKFNPDQDAGTYICITKCPELDADDNTHCKILVKNAADHFYMKEHDCPCGNIPNFCKEEESICCYLILKATDVTAPPQSKTTTA